MFNHTPELADSLTATDFPSESVQVYLGENDPEGFCVFDRAFWASEGSQKDGKYFVVYTEHLGYFVFSEWSVSLIRGLRRIRGTMDWCECAEPTECHHPLST